MPNCKSFIITEDEKKHVRRRARFLQHRDASYHQVLFFFLQDKAPKKIHAILTKVLREHASSYATTFHNANTKKGNSNTKLLAYMSLVRPILEYGAAYWEEPYREGQISTLERVQRKRPNLHIIRTLRTEKLWRCVESYHAYVTSSNRTLRNARGSLLVTDYNGHTI